MGGARSARRPPPCGLRDRPISSLRAALRARDPTAVTAPGARPRLDLGRSRRAVGGGGLALRVRSSTPSLCRRVGSKCGRVARDGRLAPAATCCCRVSTCCAVRGGRAGFTPSVVDAIALRGGGSECGRVARNGRLTSPRKVGTRRAILLRPAVTDDASAHFRPLNARPRSAAPSAIRNGLRSSGAAAARCGREATPRSVLCLGWTSQRSC